MPAKTYPKSPFERSKMRLQNIANLVEQPVRNATVNTIGSGVDSVGAMYQAGKNEARTGMGGIGDMPLPLRVAGAVGAEGVNQAAEGVEGGMDMYRKMMSGPANMVGKLTSIPSQAIGMGVGAIGTPIANAIEGKPLGQNLLQNIMETGDSTAKFGQNIGREAAMTAPLMGAGKIVTGATAIPDVRGVMQDVRSGNVGPDTGLKAGAAAAKAFAAYKQPNWTPGGVFDKQLEALGNYASQNGSIPMAGSMKAMKIHPEDQQRMIQFIDQSRLGGVRNPQLEVDARRMADFYGLRNPKRAGDLANSFDDVLSRIRQAGK